MLSPLVGNEANLCGYATILRDVSVQEDSRGPAYSTYKETLPSVV